MKNTQKKATEECVTTRNVILAGDGRCDSPGFSAKYCTYSLMNSENNQVINVGETGSSSTMEKEGLIRVLSRVQCHDFNIQSLTTDRYVQIIKHMRERSKKKHQFDIWHTSKSVKKKLTAASKRKDCEILQKWIRPIIGHFCGYVHPVKPTLQN